jgi:hypothetical protein
MFGGSLKIVSLVCDMGSLFMDTMVC